MKKITDDWLSFFPELSYSSQNKLYKIVGPIVIGIELTKLPRTKEYRPHFVMYPLWKKDVKTSLDAPIILKEYYNKKGLQYSIPYEAHNSFFSDVVESIHKQTPLPFKGVISFKKIASVIDEYSNEPPLSAAPNSYLQAAIQEAKLKIALFISIEEAQSVMEEVSKRSWDTNHFKAWGIDLGRWLKGLQETIADRDGFLKQIEINKQDKKILQLKRSEFKAQ